MVVEADLSQSGDSIKLPLLESGGSPVANIDVGKPELIVHDAGGTAFPRVQDQWSGMQTINLVGRFVGSSAYQDAIDLVELIHKDGGGNAMILDIPTFTELDSNIKVAPAAEQKQALNLVYDPGRKDEVQFDLGLTRVGNVFGSYSRTIPTPTKSGSGPIQISGFGNTIDLEVDVQVQRNVGRPNDTIRKTTGLLPNYFTKRKVVHDGIEISLQFNENALNKTRDLADMFKERLGREGLTLNFNGIYGLGEFSVMPSGNGALRHVRETGKKDVRVIPTIKLERIN